MSASQLHSSEPSDKTACPDALSAQTTEPSEFTIGPTAADDQREYWRQKNRGIVARRHPFEILSQQIVKHTRRQSQPHQDASSEACAIITVLPDHSDVPTSKLTPSMVSVHRLEQRIVDIFPHLTQDRGSSSHGLADLMEARPDWRMWKLTKLFEKVQSKMPEPLLGTQGAPSTRSRSIAVSLLPQFQGVSAKGLTARMLDVWTHDVASEPTSPIEHESVNGTENGIDIQDAKRCVNVDYFEFQHESEVGGDSDVDADGEVDCDIYGGAS